MNGYNNWNFIHYIDSVSYTLVPDGSGNAESNNLHIERGDAAFIGLHPVVKYGGSLVHDDTIKTGTDELIGDMTIENGVDLIINSDYIANATITLEGTGFIIGDGYFYLQDAGKVILSSWDRSLFKSKNGNYSKVIWGKHPGGNPTYYKVYKRINQGSWIYLAQVNSPTQEFTDSSFNINSTSGPWVQADYKVTAFVGGSESSYSNIITYKTPNYSSVTSSIINGWQMLSVPVVVPDYRDVIVWPTNDPNSYTYKYCGTGYVPEDTLENGKGYYLKFNSAQAITYVGGKIDAITVPVCSQWNIVGSISHIAPISTNVCLHPGGNIFLSPFYIYNNGYVQVDTIKPGMVHWVKIQTTGELEINKNPITCDIEYLMIAEENYDHFIITDALDKEQDLYVANLSLDPSLNEIDLSMPPPNPEVEFDARFEEGE